MVRGFGGARVASDRTDNPANLDTSEAAATDQAVPAARSSSIPEARHTLLVRWSMSTTLAGLPALPDDLLRIAVAAYLAQYQGLSRVHTDSDLRVFLRWCAERDLDPLAVRRVDVELYVRWLQEERRFKPSTVSRRLSVVVCFYRTCVIDAILDQSPAAHVRRPPLSAESPTLGLSHLQFEAMLVAARTSANACDFALVAMLGLLGLRIFEACAADIADLGEEHGHRGAACDRQRHQDRARPAPPAVARAIDRAVGDRTAGPILLNRAGTRMDRNAATRRLKHLAASAGVRMPNAPSHVEAYVRYHHARRRRQPPRRPDRRPPRRSADHNALRPCPPKPRSAPQLHPRRLHGLRNLTPSAL
jgi:integrase/recombinase XerD